MPLQLTSTSWRKKKIEWEKKNAWVAILEDGKRANKQNRVVKEKRIPTCLGNFNNNRKNSRSGDKYRVSRSRARHRPTRNLGRSAAIRDGPRPRKVFPSHIKRVKMLLATVQQFRLFTVHVYISLWHTIRPSSWWEAIAFIPIFCLLIKQRRLGKTSASLKQPLCIRNGHIHLERRLIGRDVKSQATNSIL